MRFNLKTENINFIKIIYKDELAFSHYVKASIKDLTDREIYASVKLEEFLKIDAPQKVEIGIATNNGIYKAQTTLKYTRYEEPYLLLWLETPDDIDYFQNREYFRVKLNENASISYKTENDIASTPCETDDISANGVRCIIDEDITFPENVQITLFFQNKSIKTNAKFIRTEKDGDIYKASFNFVDLQQNDSDFISQICLQKQLEEKRKTLM